jgi:hypothetical protein
MSFDTVVFILIVVVIGAVSIVKKLKEMVEGQVERGGDVHVDYEATPAEIQEFLRSISTGRPQQANVQAPPAPRPAPVRRQARPAQPAQAPAERSFWDALESPAPAAPVPVEQPTPPPAPVRAEEPRPQAVTRRRRTRRREPTAVPVEAVKPSEAPAAEKAKAAAGVTPLALKNMDLRQAFAWSEILAPPVAVRRQSRRR